MSNISRSWLCVAGFLSLVGCGKPTDPQNASEKSAATNLKLFGMGYEIYLENNQRPPRKLDDLKTVISSDEPIDFDHYHIIWGVDLKSIPQPRTVLAYEVDVPEKGGMVLFHDKKVERVSAEEFAKLPKATSAKPLAERPADATFTPTEYFAEFKKLNMAMGKKYEGKVIELKGIVQGLGRLSGKPELLVISPGNKHEDVRCYMSGEEEFWTKISKGQEVTVRGLVRQPQATPILVDCGIVNAGPNTTVTTTAEELAKEYATDSTKASAKYQGKSFILTGEVDSIEVLGTLRGVKLKVTTKQPVVCLFHSDKDRDKKFVPGAKLKLYAEDDDHETRLANCELISK